MPHVPGAGLIKPEPKPSAKKCTGLDNWNAEVLLFVLVTKKVAQIFIHQNAHSQISFAIHMSGRFA